MTSTGKTTTGKYAADVQTPTQSPAALGGGHKASFKSTKLARRARSFKDDFLGKISQMRSPTGQIGGRSHSPKSHPKFNELEVQSSASSIRNAGAQYPLSPGKDPVQELNHFCKQIQIALKHLRDVISKGKLEMLSGNGTVVLDTVWHINLAVKSLNTENSNSIISATSCMYQSVARLIKLCDDVLIDDKSSELNESNVKEIVDQVEEAVKNLIALAQEKIQQHKSTNSHYMKNSSSGGTASGSGLEVPQRNSLPDIPLSPREREILEKTSCATGGSNGGPTMRNSRSTESILRAESPPPPKPPLPERHLDSIGGSGTITPPPLPPKKKNRLRHISDDFSNELYNFSSPITNSFERVSLRSKSPEDSFSLLSESGGSIDSMLNQSSRDEDNEIKAIMDDEEDDDEEDETDFGDTEHFDLTDFHQPGIGTTSANAHSWEESSLSSAVYTNNSSRHYHHLHHTSVSDYHRLSNTDSGISSLRFSSYSQRSSQQSSISTTTKCYQQEAVEDGQKREEEDVPPIPQKTRKKLAPPPPVNDRQPSPYDNVTTTENDKSCAGQFLVTCQLHQTHQSSSSSTSISSSTVVDGTIPPPLPPKKKHIMAYMEMFGNCSHVNDQEFMRHSIHNVQSNWMQPNKITSGSATLPTAQSCSFSHHYQQQQQQQHHHQSTSSAITGTTTQHLHHHHSSSSSSRYMASHHSTLAIPLSNSSSSSHSPNDRTPSPIVQEPTTPPALPPKQRSRKESSKSSCSSPPATPTSAAAQEASDDKLPSNQTKSALPDLLEHTAVIAATDKAKESSINSSSNRYDVDLMEELNVDEYLVRKKKDEEGPEIRGGAIDALIIQATKATKNGVFAYQEAFLTTYRTFITPMDLINKLIRRYNHFYYQPEKKPRSREAFALIVRVVSDLTASDLDEKLQKILMRFVQQLIECGELTLAKALRVKHLERQDVKMRNQRQIANVTSSVTLIPRDVTLLSFKSDHLAEQMTLLDADLFMKIEIPEVLIWAQEQNEERSPNLTKFTEHFNKMSYWARTLLLTAETKEIREKYFLKFIKVMKHLRKINNFNSYLALLSALDSAPIRRLEWQKHVQEGLKEYCALIDSSSSFRAYRQALAETQPPCIPYIGLVLQDLTFVHIGNSNTLPDGSVNFTKRWQQFNIVENMKKFKMSAYTFKKNEKIIEFFQNFDNCIGEDAMWQLSEAIKPRGSKKVNV